MINYTLAYYKNISIYFISAFPLQCVEEVLTRSESCIFIHIRLIDGLDQQATFSNVLTIEAINYITKDKKKCLMAGETNSDCSVTSKDVDTTVNTNINTVFPF